MAELKKEIECPYCGKKICLTVQDFDYSPKRKSYSLSGIAYHYVCERCHTGFTTTASDTESVKTWKKTPNERK